MRKIILFTLYFIFISLLYSQSENEKRDFGISFKGFVKSELMFDSRQTITAREGHLLLYPAAEKNDLSNDDINATPNLNMLSIQTRLTGVISAPDAFGAKTSGVVEGAFFGHSNGDINGFRLRHAFIKLAWQKTTLILGQYWHPMFITDCFPGVVSFNTGMPFAPFSRNPQIRLINKFSDMYVSLTAATQRDFSNSGPSGSTSTYLRNSSIPILDINLMYKKAGTVAGISANYKTLKPYLEFEGYKVENTISSYSAMAFAKFDLGKLNVKLEGIYGTNLTDLIMLGGYAIKEYGAEGDIEYTGSKIVAGWTDITFGKETKFGLFAGYTKNLGTEDENMGDYFSRGSSIDIVWRVSPRIQHQMGKTRLAAELEYTTADYGTPDVNGEVQNTTSVSNIRLLVAAYLFF